MYSRIMALVQYLKLDGLNMVFTWISMIHISTWPYFMLITVPLEMPDQRRQVDGSRHMALVYCVHSTYCPQTKVKVAFTVYAVRTTILYVTLLYFVGNLGD